jgi:tetratricopeptide (TPR) repeat protein
MTSGYQMIIPGKRFRFSTFKVQKRARFIRSVILFVAVAGILGGGLYFAGRAGLSALLNRAPSPKTLISLWESKKYGDIIQETQEELKKNAMDPQALIFGGFANFYTGVSKTAMEDKIPYLDRSIQQLRRALLVKSIPLKGEVDYVLGKAYYHKGSQYYDLSAKYMLASFDNGYTGEDSHEYLGLAYSGMARYDVSVKYFLTAIERHPSDLLYLTLAQTYYQMSDFPSAEEYLQRCINRSSDTILLQKAHSLLGNIYMQRKEYLKAQEEYLKLIEYNSKSTEAHFNLGEIYFALGDSVKARAEWRNTLKVDPRHYGALKRLYK